MCFWFRSLVQLGKPQRWQEGERKGRKSSEGNTPGVDPHPLPSSNLAGPAQKCLCLWGRTSFRSYASKSLDGKNSCGKFMFKPGESKLQRGGRREGGRLALSGTRPAVPAGPTNARWRGGHSSTPPRHGAQPAACVNTQRTPEVQLWFFIPNTQPTPAPPRLGDAEFIARRPIVWQGPPKPRCYPSTLHIKLFSSLCCSVTFHHAPFPTIFLVWQHDGFGLSAFQCQSILTLWQTRHSCKLTSMTSPQKWQLCTLCHLCPMYASESKLYSKPWKPNPSIYATS